jgi:dephospho-CoA kinase
MSLTKGVPKMAGIILALSGPRACGKSTISQHLANYHGYTRIAFSDSLRDIARCAGDQFIDDRNYLARLGATLREIWPELLLKAVSQRIAACDGPVVIEDIRFPAEFEFCKSIGAVTIRFEIDRKEQFERLASRDGKTALDAEQLLDCNDENLLEGIEGWDVTCVAEGDFKELTSQLVKEIERMNLCLESDYIQHNRIQESWSESLE